MSGGGGRYADLRDPLDDVRSTADYADRRARGIPEEPALIDDERELSWGELRAESDRLAAGLLDRVGPRALVFEQLHNCVELFVLRLACEKAGIRLLTAPRTFRSNELDPLFDQLRPELAIVPGRYRGVDYGEVIRDVDHGSLRTTVSLDDTSDESYVDLLDDHDGIAPSEARIAPDGVSQLALTSGSSGTPTCVEVSPAARIRTGIVQARRYGLSGEDTIGVVTPLVSGAPDAMAYHGAPVFGGTVVLFDRFDPERVCERIRNDLTVLPAVPTVTAKLVDHVVSRDRDDVELETIVNYGDVLPTSVGRRAEEVFGCRVQQAFGTADGGGICATASGESTGTRLWTVGRPLDGNEVVLETDDGTVANPEAGVSGTLLVRGPHRVGRPLVGDVDEVGPYFEVSVRATYDDDGRIVLLGRESEVIIRGGRNIYPAEIENALQSHRSISEAAVVGAPDETLGERPFAFVVPAEGERFAVDRVLEYLESDRGLAAFKRPERIITIDDLPLVPAGHKVDRNALRERAEAANSAGQE